MKILGKGLTRRGLLKRIGVAVAVLPVLPLGKAVADKEKQRLRKKRLANMEDIWIGHC